jgi:hypothetical protein
MLRILENRPRTMISWMKGKKNNKEGMRTACPYSHLEFFKIFEIVFILYYFLYINIKNKLKNKFKIYF